MVYDLEDLSLSLNALLTRDDTYSYWSFEINKGAEDQVGRVRLSGSNIGATAINA